MKDIINYNLGNQRIAGLLKRSQQACLRTNRTNFTLNYIITGILTSAARCLRIFNPVLQSPKFDQNGDYIRKWIPELHNIDVKDIHALCEIGIKVTGYPEQPIIEHDKERTLREYKLSKEEIRA